MIKLAGILQSPWTDGVEGQIDDLWDSEVAPALLELRETIADHSLAREVAAHMATDVKELLLTGGAVFLGMTSPTSMGPVAASVAGAGATAAAAVVRGAWDREAGRRDAQRHGPYYLYESERRLGT